MGFFPRVFPPARVGDSSEQDVCSGRSGHAEVVMVEYDPAIVTTQELLDIFWKSHDPTQVSSQTKYQQSIMNHVILV